MANAEVLLPEDLIPDQMERTVLQAMYKPIEYATAFKPKLMLSIPQTKSSSSIPTCQSFSR